METRSDFTLVPVWYLLCPTKGTELDEAVPELGAEWDTAAEGVPELGAEWDTAAEAVPELGAEWDTVAECAEAAGGFKKSHNEK